MVNYREILRLKFLGNSMRKTTGLAHCSDHTVKAVWEKAEKLQVAWPLDDDITNADLGQLLFPEKYKNTCMYVEPDCPYIHRELAKNGVPLTLLWEEYRSKCYETSKTPYMEYAVCGEYRKWARVTKATMRIQHKPGDANLLPWSEYMQYRFGGE